MHILEWAQSMWQSNPSEQDPYFKVREDYCWNLCGSGNLNHLNVFDSWQWKLAAKPISCQITAVGDLGRPSCLLLSLPDHGTWNRFGSTCFFMLPTSMSELCHWQSDPAVQGRMSKSGRLVTPDSILMFALLSSIVNSRHANAEVGWEDWIRLNGFPIVEGGRLVWARANKGVSQ